MCELDILHDSLYQFCPELHLKRLNSLTLMNPLMIFIKIIK
ncbi:TPA: hypothetical protein ACPDN3_004946, partial [Escherichia coli]